MGMIAPSHSLFSPWVSVTMSAWSFHPHRDPGGTMTHVSLDSQDEKVKQFVLGLTVDPSGSVLELNGQPVACIVAPPKTTHGTADAEPWTGEKNARRVALIERKHAAGLAPAEHVELAGLQDEMLRFRRRVAPLPLEDSRRLHQELLAQAAAARHSSK
jgi:hypothetical protein